MAIKVKNLVVGGKKLPTTTDKISFKSLVKVHSETLQPEKEQTVVIRPTKAAVQESPSNYIKKVDGELIRHINKKSTYLSDMLEIDHNK
jgi:hypothetical protein